MTTTATERPTLTNSQALALPVGTRVEFLRYGEWKVGTVTDQNSLQEHNRQPEYLLVRPEEDFGWRDGEGRYWFATEGVRTVDAFTFGDRVQFTRGDRTYYGTVVGHYAPPAGRHSWMVADESLPTSSDPWAYRRGAQSATDEGGFTFVNPWPSPDPLAAWIPERDLSPVPNVSDTAAAPVSNNDEAERILRMIGEALAETADRSEWCGEYERLLDQLVDSLPYGNLRDVFSDAARRDREYSVRVSYTISGSTYVSVSASSADAAQELVADDPWTYVDAYGIRSSITAEDVEIEDVETDE